MGAFRQLLNKQKNLCLNKILECEKNQCAILNAVKTGFQGEGYQTIIKFMQLLL